MLTEKELNESKNYWLSKMQLQIFRELENYRKKNNLSKGDLAKKMGYSNAYISQLLSADKNISLGKLIEISIICGKKPILKFVKSSSNNA